MQMFKMLITKLISQQKLNKGENHFIGFMYPNLTDINLHE